MIYYKRGIKWNAQLSVLGPLLVNILINDLERDGQKARIDRLYKIGCDSLEVSLGDRKKTQNDLWLQKRQRQFQAASTGI